MNTAETMKTKQAFTQELAAHVKGLTAILPALAIVAALAGKELLEVEMMKLQAMSEDISCCVDEERSQEMKKFIADREKFSKEVEKIKSIDLDETTLHGARYLVSSAPEVLARSYVFMANHTAELIQILDEQEKRKDD